MSGSVLQIAAAVDDVRFDTVLDCLTEVLARAKDGYPSDPEFKPTGVMVILVDQNGGKYAIKRHCSSMKTSHLVALLEVAKYQELKLLEPVIGD